MRRLNERQRTMKFVFCLIMTGINILLAVWGSCGRSPDYADILRPVFPPPDDEDAEQPHETTDAADGSADPWQDTNAPTTDDTAPTSGEE